jgi:GH15 family glucan-1,4-alpha-glucosidase
MLKGIKTYGLAVVLAFSTGMLAYSPQSESNRAWEGYSILGNGHLTAVYSDDGRISKSTHSQGIQHFYFRDYTADYLASTSFELLDRSGKALGTTGSQAVGMKNFFTTQTQTGLANGGSETVLCFVHPGDAAVLSIGVSGASRQVTYKFNAVLRTQLKTDHEIGLSSLQVQDNIALAVWSNGTVAALLPKSARDRTTVSEASVSITGQFSGDGVTNEVLVIPGSSKSEVLAKARAFQQKKDLESEAREFWNSWMNSGKLPAFKASNKEGPGYLECYKRNLYCVKSANLQGQIPADITGQFVTNNMPQLYPRDAMMCARALLATGHAEEAKQVLEFWARREIPMKTPGEWYARYDAHGKAVDAGSGARYDEPEWDANGYFIYLVNRYHEQTGSWPVNKSLIYKLADFLVNHLDRNGLLYEGGIVEWTGYLPATNMICAAALKTAAKMAQQFGDAAKAALYTSASGKISEAMPQMFDPIRQTYADVRFAESKGANNVSIADKSGKKVYLWDTTANVGIIWGYPNHREIELSNAFYAKNTVAPGGGMRYFDSTDPALAEYGHGIFFFTSAAAAEYQFLQGNVAAGKRFLDWMLRNANSYGLMPEHISPNGSRCSPASPLSWCSAEFAAAVLFWSQLQ